MSTVVDFFLAPPPFLRNYTPCIPINREFESHLPRGKSLRPHCPVLDRELDRPSAKVHNDILLALLDTDWFKNIREDQAKSVRESKQCATTPTHERLKSVIFRKFIVKEWKRLEKKRRKEKKPEKQRTPVKLSLDPEERARKALFEEIAGGIKYCRLNPRLIKIQKELNEEANEEWNLARYLERVQKAGWKNQNTFYEKLERIYEDGNSLYGHFRYTLSDFTPSPFPSPIRMPTPDHHTSTIDTYAAEQSLRSEFDFSDESEPADDSSSSSEIDLPLNPIFVCHSYTENIVIETCRKWDTGLLPRAAYPVDQGFTSVIPSPPFPRDNSLIQKKFLYPIRSGSKLRPATPPSSQTERKPEKKFPRRIKIHRHPVARSQRKRSYEAGEPQRESEASLWLKRNGLWG
ncbi:hypothetical protein RUND412_004265 [Rhizina undulata]